MDEKMEVNDLVQFVFFDPNLVAIRLDTYLNDCLAEGHKVLDLWPLHNGVLLKMCFREKVVQV